jgi:hypothetical protein
VARAEKNETGGGWTGVRVFTIGHSTRPLDELVALLRAFDVRVLADVRTIPRSRHNPQYDGEALRAALRARGPRYVHLPDLGGLRKPRADSPNAGWRNASFRGYADYMETPGFARGLEALRALADDGPVAIMCAEAVPWRCHRSLVADALTVRGAEVEHITGPRHASPHKLTPFAVIEGERLAYPPGPSAADPRGAAAQLLLKGVDDAGAPPSKPRAARPRARARGVRAQR